MEVLEIDIFEHIETTLNNIAESKDKSFIKENIKLFSDRNIKDLISSIFEFSKTRLNHIFELEHKTKLLQTTLERKAVNMAKKYSQILLNKKKYQIDHRNNNFFENLIKFIITLFRPIYSESQLHLLEEELVRMLKTSAVAQCNLPDERKTSRKIHSKKDTDKTIQEIIERMQDKRKDKAKDSKLRTSPYKALYTRSPMLSLILPSPGDKLKTFEENRRKKIHRPSKSQLPSLEISFRPDINII